MGSIGIAILIILVLSSFYFVQRPTETIRIGVIFPLSGNAAYYGLQGQNGIELAKEEIIIEYPNLNIQVLYEDSQYIPKEGVNAYTKLKNMNEIDAIIPMASHVSIALRGLANQDNVIEMAVASTSGAYSMPDDFSFRTIPSVGVQTIKIHEFLKTNNYQNIAMLTVNNDFGKGGKDALKNQFKDGSIKIVSEQDFMGDATDFRTELTKIKESDAEIIYLVGTAANYVILLSQAKKLNIQKQFISISSTEDPTLLNNIEVAEGIIYTYYDIDTINNPVAKKFVDSYIAKYNESPDGYAAEGYVALSLLALAYNECGEDNSCAKNYLENIKNYDSVFGPLTFDGNGDVDYDFILKTVKDGRFVPYLD